MKTRFPALPLLVIASASALYAQNVGDSASSVEAALGRPSSKLANGKKEIWLYPQGKKVVLTDGVVSQIENPPPKVSPAKPASVSSKPAPVGASAPAPEMPSRMNRGMEIPDSAAIDPHAKRGLRVILSAVGHELKLPPDYRIESQRNFAGEMSAFQAMGPTDTYLGGNAALMGEDPVSAAQFASSGDDALKEGATVETIEGWKIYVWTFENNKKEKLKSFRAVKSVGGVGYVIAMIAAHDRDDAVLKKELLACLKSIRPLPRK